MKINAKKILSTILAAAICTTVLSSCDNSSNSDDEATDNGWTYGQVAMGGGGFVTGVFATAEENLYYARTDVGGAYRWDNEKGSWVSMSYNISEPDRGLLGIDGLASDPNAPNKVYLLAGTSYFSDAKTAILCSDDYGKTFTEVDVTSMIKAHGNGMGRQNGERIAVDPNNGDIIFCDGRSGGIIKSIDGGKTWTPVDSFPVKTTSNATGINGVLFDASSSESGSATSRIYVSVSRLGEANIYVSENGGESWSEVSALPTEYMPQRMKFDANGNILITYGDAEGPHNGKNGAIYRYNPSTKTAEDISPANHCFGDIVSDPNNANNLVASTINVWNQQPNGSYGDEFYVSKDGGATWTCINKTMQMANGGVEWVTGYAIHWCGSLMIDPYNPNTIMVVSGNGIFRCDNIWDDAPTFTFFVKGLEETVPLDCVSLPGQNLLTAIGDYDGFDHSNILEYGRLHTKAVGTTTSVAIAPANPDFWVKVGSSLLYSEDGGDSWTTILNSPDPSKKLSKGCVAVNADGSTIIWVPEDGTTGYYTTDKGETWERTSGGARTGSYVLGDTVNPNYVYSCGGSNFSVSSDGGKTFTSTLSTIGSYNRFAVAAGQEGVLYVAGSGYGLFTSTDHGMNFTRLDSVKVCETVSLGKGKTDNDPYVIYMWGIPADQEIKGLYMSEDNGESWVRINDDLHQFGGIGNGKFVCGDYNVYGRCYMSTVGLGLIYCDKTDKS